MIGLTIATILGVAASITTLPQTGMGYYPMTTVITDINYDTNEVTCTDFTGNQWVFTGCEDWNEDEICTLLMCDNGTDIIYDDIIISEHYDGWFDGWNK